MVFGKNDKHKKTGVINLKERLKNIEEESNRDYEYRAINGKSVLFDKVKPLDVEPVVDRNFPEYSENPWPSEADESINAAPLHLEASKPEAIVSSIENRPDATVKQKKKEEVADNTEISLFDLTIESDAEKERKKKEENDAVIRVRDKVRAQFTTRILNERDDPKFKEELYAWIEDALKDEGRYIGAEKRVDVAKRITNLIVGLGPLEQLLDKGYTEIMVTHFDKIYVEEKGGMVLSGAEFGSEEELQTLIYQIASSIGRTINISDPICDGWLKDGSRFNAVLPPIAADGAFLTIRRFSDKKLTGEDYLKFGSLNEDILKFFDYAVRARFNLICSGGTGSGKTSLLNLMSNYLSYDPGLSVLSIEDSLELRINHPNVRREETRKSTSKDGSGEITARTLVKNALRQRPDRIIIGEIRDGTIADFLRAAGSGHDGCMTTIHANSPQELESQIVVLFMMADDYNLDSDTIKMMYAQAVDIVIQIERQSDHARRITQISHIVGYGLSACEELGIKPGDPEYSDSKVFVRDIFRFVKTGRKPDGTLIGEYVPTGYIPKALLKKADINGVDIDLSIFKPKNQPEEKETEVQKHEKRADSNTVIDSCIKILKGLEDVLKSLKL